MTMVAKVFKNGRSQAIRIPKEFRVSTDEVYIDKEGDKLIIKEKKKNNLDDFFEALEELKGFDFEIEKLPVQERELF